MSSHSDSESSTSSRSSTSPGPRGPPPAHSAASVPRDDESTSSRSRSLRSFSPPSRARDVEPRRRLDSEGRSRGQTHRSSRHSRDVSRVESSSPRPSPSPPIHRSSPQRRRDESLERDRRPLHGRSRMESSDFFGDAAPRDRREHSSRSPGRNPASTGRDGRDHDDRRRYRERDEARQDRSDQPPRQPPQRQPPRERSLSPFSKRLALTQAMNSSR